MHSISCNKNNIDVYKKTVESLTYKKTELDMMRC